MSIAPGAAIASLAAVEAAAVALDFNTIILALIGLAGAWVSMKVATLSAAAKEAKLITDKTADTMEQIHVAVNSKDTATSKKIDDLNALVLELSETIKTLEENKRGAELAKAIAAVPPVMVMPSAPVMPLPASAPSTAPAGKLEHAIGELTEAAKDTVVAADKTVDLTGKVPRTS